MPLKSTFSADTRQRLEALQASLRKVPSAYFGKSFYIFDENALNQAIQAFESHLPGVTPFYAMKANDQPEILTVLAAAGWSFDAASAAEVEKLIALGVGGERIILANPFKDRATLSAMDTHQVAMTTADSPEELRKLAEIFAHRAEQPRVLIRISLPSEGVQTDLGVKFGCPPQQAVSLLEQCLRLGLQPGGISFHVGTQSWNPDNYTRHFEGAFWVLKEFEARSGVKLDLIDIGGGFPWGSANGSGLEHVRPLLAAVGEMTRSAQQQGFRVQAQPGRVICAGAYTLVSTVIGKTERNGKPWYYLSDGVYGAYNGVLYDHQSYLFLPADRPLEADPCVSAVVCGPTCDGVDIMGHDILLPETLTTGEHLFTPDIGAYSMVAASQFNGFSRAPILFADQLERETILQHPGPEPLPLAG